MCLHFSSESVRAGQVSDTNLHNIQTLGQTTVTHGHRTDSDRPRVKMQSHPLFQNTNGESYLLLIDGNSEADVANIIDRNLRQFCVFSFLSDYSLRNKRPCVLEQILWMVNTSLHFHKSWDFSYEKLIVCSLRAHVLWNSSRFLQNGMLFPRKSSLEFWWYQRGPYWWMESGCAWFLSSRQ